MESSLEALKYVLRSSNTLRGRIAHSMHRSSPNPDTILIHGEVTLLSSPSYNNILCSPYVAEENIRKRQRERKGDYRG
jgi:hypothetical protein